MTLPLIDPTFRIYLTLAQYPILQSRIRSRMRKEMYLRGVIDSNEFKRLVRDQAIQSQLREGLNNPYAEEAAEIWGKRLSRVRNYLTDVHFANNFPYEFFEETVRNALEERGALDPEDLINFNAELAPQDLIIEQAESIANLPEEDRKRFEPRLQELKVVLIRQMISDQLAYIKIARKHFHIQDLLNIQARKIGVGKIGGKAAGMLLAQRILLENGDPDVRERVHIPESYFLAADVMYSFMAHNDLMHWADQKYKDDEAIHNDYPLIINEFLGGEFPEEILEGLESLLEELGKQPLIVRSSSLLEDNFGNSFAGKYDSVFCPNQASSEENLNALTKAIASVYASGLNPDALLYRRQHDLQDYDERMAILIQVVEGGRVGKYHLPHAAGVAFSRNFYRWSPQIERDAGFLRLVWGMGTRAVDRVGNDYPRLVALSHPLLHSHSDPRAIRKYSQVFVDAIDIEENLFVTKEIDEVMDGRDPALRYVAQLYQNDYLSPIRSNLMTDSQGDLVITMDELLRRTPIAGQMKRALQTLEYHYRSPVDMEFALRIKNPGTTKPEVEIAILQCRPQSHLKELDVRIPNDLLEEDIVFSTSRVLPHGLLSDIKYVLYVRPEAYYSLPSIADRVELGMAIGRLNVALENECFICIGPGRWGTTNPDLGVRIGYSEIYNSRALIELSGQGIGSAPEPSFGTHFFQDLLESQIFPLAIFLDDEDAIFSDKFFNEMPNRIGEFVSLTPEIAGALHLIRVEDYREDASLELVIDGQKGRAVAYMKAKEIKMENME